MLRAIKTLIWLGIALLTLASLGIAMVNASRDQFVATIFLVAFGIGLVFSVWKRKWFIDALGSRSPTAREKMYQDFIEKNDFNVDHVLEGSVPILFDTKARRMAFFYSDGIVEHPYDYIRGWEERWTERGTRTFNHKFDVRLNNLNRPVLTITPKTGNFSVGDRQSAARWSATLDLILNGDAR